MNGYPFQAELFKNVFELSRAIEGRFFVAATFLGKEINLDELGQILQNYSPLSGRTKKYPLCMQMPPVSTGFYTDKNGEWESFRAVLFFLTATYYDGNNQVKYPDQSTGHSSHAIFYDWHDMKRCAVNFVYVLNKFTRDQGLINGKFRIDQQRERIITPVTQIGTDKASGVRLDLNWSQFVGCQVEDYELDDISSIKIPQDDSHPEHQM